MLIRKSLAGVLWRFGWCGGCDPQPSKPALTSSLLRSERKDQSGRNPADFYDFLFMGGGIHQASFTRFMKQGLSSHFLPGSVCLPTKSHCWRPKARCMHSPQMGPDVSHPGLHVPAHPLAWLSASSADCPAHPSGPCWLHSWKPCYHPQCAHPRLD